MNTYTIIRSDKQYKMYCNDLEKLTLEYQTNPSEELLNLIDTVTLLVEKYDEENTQLKEVDPIQLLKSLMKENNINQNNLSEFLRISKGHLSDILNYKKGLSKNIIRKLSEKFKVRQEAFNRNYKLSVDDNRHYRDANIMNQRKDIENKDQCKIE